MKSSYTEYQLQAISKKLFEIQQHQKIITDALQAIQVFANNIKGELE